jgi:hypothetical protein
MRKLGLIIVALAVLGWGSAAWAGTADVVFLVDESGSMGGEHAWIVNMVTDLETGLVGAGVTPNQYALIGFGSSVHGSSQWPHKHTVGTGDWGTAAELATAAGGLVASGGTEDGWNAVDYFFQNYTPRTGSALNVVLITDEDRDIQNAALTYASTLAQLTGANALFNVVVDGTFSAPGPGGAVLGVDAGGNAYIADGAGGYTSVAGGGWVSGWGTTKADYVDMAWATNAAAWDLNQLRAGGLTATSFTKAFVDIKVKETIEKVIPLPPAGLLGLGLLGVLGAFRAVRRRRAT